MERYGRETYTGSADHQSKMDFKEIAQKAWITKIANGSCSKSLPEERLNSILVKEYGADAVSRQMPVIRQWVDFYLDPLTLFVQVDGTYWHGLNRPFEQIEAQKTTQDVKIYKQILRDRKLNAHMTENGLNIVRITDEQMIKMTDEEILNHIQDKGNWLCPTTNIIVSPKTKSLKSSIPL